MNDVRLIGPGVWFMLHKLAAIATDRKSKVLFLEVLKFVVENYPCEKCKVHLKAHIESTKR